ncbi:hypothetical protein U1Q18_048364, partial [Sarracenia purpurea var. burkii]
KAGRRLNIPRSWRQMVDRFGHLRWFIICRLPDERIYVIGGRQWTRWDLHCLKESGRKKMENL